MSECQPGDADVRQALSSVCFGVSYSSSLECLHFFSPFFFKQQMAEWIRWLYWFIFFCFKPARSCPIRKNEAWCQNVRGSIIITRQIEKCGHLGFGGGKSASVVGLTIVKLVVMLILLLAQCVCLCVKSLATWSTGEQLFGPVCGNYSWHP